MRELDASDALLTIGALASLSALFLLAWPLALLGVGLSMISLAVLWRS